MKPPKLHSIMSTLAAWLKRTAALPHWKSLLAVGLQPHLVGVVSQNDAGGCVARRSSVEVRQRGSLIWTMTELCRRSSEAWCRRIRSQGQWAEPRCAAAIHLAILAAAGCGPLGTGCNTLGCDERREGGPLAEGAEPPAEVAAGRGPLEWLELPHGWVPKARVTVAGDCSGTDGPGTCGGKGRRSDCAPNWHVVS